MNELLDFAFAVSKVLALLVLLLWIFVVCDIYGAGFYKWTADFLYSHPGITDWLLKRAQRTPYSHITSVDGTDVYMYRWWLFNPYDQETHATRWSWIPFSIRLHHIMRPDADRHLHSHPWDAQTIILRGWYTEERAVGVSPVDPTELRTVGHARFSGTTASLKFGEYHRINAIPPEGVLTMFITFRFQGTWCFWVKGKEIPHYEYHKTIEQEICSTLERKAEIRRKLVATMKKEDA